jgi:hypothetical protein
VAVLIHRLSTELMLRISGVDCPLERDRLEAPLLGLSGRIHVTSDPRQYQSGPLGHRLVVAEDSGLFEHAVGQGGLGAVDGGDDPRSSLCSVSTSKHQDGPAGGEALRWNCTGWEVGWEHASWRAQNPGCHGSRTPHRLP